MSLFELAIIVMIAVGVLAPISIYFMLKYYDLDTYRKRFRKTNPFIFWRNKPNNDS